MRRILAEERLVVLHEERRLLGDLRVFLVRHAASPENQKALARSIAQLDELFLLVVVGEFNAGKSSVINALVGDKVLDEGVTPTTSRIGLLRHGEPGRATVGVGLEQISLPLDVLREITIVDTPGTNAVLREHEALTREFVPRSDVILFVTSADRPFTESERAFLETIQSWGKKVVVVLNKIDILETAEEKEAVVAFVKEKVLALLRFRPRVFPISARQARRAKAEANDALLRTSGFESLEAFVTQTLNESVRVRLKLANPLAVGLRVLDEAQRSADDQAAPLEEDQATLSEIEAELARHRDDLARDLRPRLADVERPLFDLEKRGIDFIHETHRIARLFDLLSVERTRTRFEREVVADLGQLVEKRVNDIGEWMAASEASRWQEIGARLERRKGVHAARLAGRGWGTVEYDRSRPLREIRREAQKVMESNDLRKESRRLGEASRATAAGAAFLLLLGALALCAGIVGLAVRGLTDILALSGIAAAASLSVAGLLLLRTRRQRAKAEFHDGVGRLRQMLLDWLKVGFDRETEKSRKGALEVIEPYRRFVNGEGERVRSQRAELATLLDNLQALKARVESL
jgi:small GTP-binding protein